MGTLSSVSQKIKQSICFRAKYRVMKKAIGPLLVVPHPKNRGGDPIKSLRTKQLNASVSVEGYDPMEANCNAVAVEDKPAVAGGGSGRYFQGEFAKKAKPDPDMAEQCSGMVATVGSLAHSHLNCGMRNILCSKKGCECDENNTQCECGVQPSFGQRWQLQLGKIAGSRR